MYVKDQQKFKEFYQNLLGRKPVLDVSGVTEFKLAPNSVLGIMPEDGIVRGLEGKLAVLASARELTGIGAIMFPMEWIWLGMFWHLQGGLRRYK
ncbi:hypothetical protein AM500_22975 [Bacillus sp. FJAT-18017]|uniref:hypothetical protein n=1 Tax=Bacillus sp. FJAT-18017 TaxID=1705566 RepID=UPI0006AD91E1|nr:hypothetical protein [Bacillus sp. FJAT-18017]ALC92314.1 hypothetical protein AM500_22975 [Bacillus sp. FJAT-18017]